MREIVRVLTGVAVLLAAGLTGAQEAAVPTTAEQAPRIEGAEAKRLVEKGEAVLVDVRGKEAWDGGHAEGALHIPLNDLPQRLKELPKDKLIAAYCT
jgi:predicted sulfurtransferase